MPIISEIAFKNIKLWCIHSKKSITFFRNMIRTLKCILYRKNQTVEKSKITQTPLLKSNYYSIKYQHVTSLWKFISIILEGTIKDRLHSYFGGWNGQNHALKIIRKILQNFSAQFRPISSRFMFLNLLKAS